MEDYVLLFLNGHLGRRGDFDDAYNKCSAFAYRDMCRTIRFAEELQEEKKTKIEQKEIQEKKDSLKDKVTEKIKFKVNEWLSEDGIDKSDFDEEHASLCREIMCEYKDKVYQKNNQDECNCLSFGQAQKWVNMTLKNLYVYDDSNDKKMGMEKLLPLMHIPIDNYILEIASGERKCWIDGNKNINYNVKKPKTSWSRWSEKQYREYREQINGMLKHDFSDGHPIVWELWHWSTII